MTRKQELRKVKKIIKEYYNEANCGLFDARNIVGDIVINIFKGEYFSIDICFHYSYFEVFGTTTKEFEEIKKFYNGLDGERK